MDAFTGGILLFLVDFVRPNQLWHLLCLPSHLLFFGTCELFYFVILDSEFIRRILDILTYINRHLGFIIVF